MNRLYFYIIMVLSLIIFACIPGSYANSGSVLFMKQNSTAKIYANFTFPVLNNETHTLRPQIVTGLTYPNSFANGLSITAVPSLLVANKSNVGVTYVIAAKDDTKGVYAISLYWCGLSPLVVGFNDSEISPVIFNEFFTVKYSCPNFSQSTPKMNIIGYSNMIPKIIHANSNSNNSNNDHLVNQLGQLPESPLKQIKSGVKSSDVKCKKDFILITKHEDGKPACVTISTAIVLAERGWTTSLQIHPAGN
ncbi:MAG: hypothetical protein KGH95_01140 [Thaumarchaeota archaeon]|nr:hypothetical protein [Nitrososphaerota archaeon]